MEIMKEKNNDLQKAIKWNEETFMKTIFQYSGQLSGLTAENSMLNTKLEKEKQSKDRLETEVESYHSRLTTATYGHDQNIMLLHTLRSNLKDNVVLSQQLSKAESQFKSLEIELHHTRDALREKIVVLESVQRGLSQALVSKEGN
nr:ankyrin repeat domain-containing protein 26 [Vicugna pacos]